MNPATELREIIGQMKLLITANRDMGLDFSKYSKYIKDFIVEDKSRTTTLEELRGFIGECTRCGLSQGRKRLVFGEGSDRAKLVFVGEGPGHDEDIEGRPFVGEAGKLLTKIIENGMHLKREDVYICNVVKCRPPGNRDPEKVEIETCLPFLKEQLRIINPMVICTLGRIAVQALLGKQFKITQDRGKWYSFMDIPLMPTYHPAYILRNPARERELKGEVWEDIQAIMARLEMEVQ
jgi:uracil-DNA glycosylase family 4